MSVTPLPHRPRPPEHQQEKRTRKRREREKIAVEKGNENVLDNWFVIVFVYPPTRPEGRRGGGSARLPPGTRALLPRRVICNLPILTVQQSTSTSCTVPQST